MTGLPDPVAHILAQRRVIGRREQPELARVLDGLRARGQLVAVLPGWYAPSELRNDPWTLLAAIQRADPASIVIGRAAARLTFWPDLPVEEVEAAVSRRRTCQRGYRFEKRQVDPVHVIRTRGVRVTIPALTALDLVPRLGGDVIDHVLRAGAADLPTLRCVLTETSYRAGNTERARALLDSRDGGWSGGERRLHAILREAGITGWVTNLRVELEEGVRFLDVAFTGPRLGIELDGWTYHGRYYADFVATMRRHTAIEAAGWRVLHFTADDLDDPRWLIGKVREALGE